MKELPPLTCDLPHEKEASTISESLYVWLLLHQASLNNNRAMKQSLGFSFLNLSDLFHLLQKLVHLLLVGFS